MVNFGRDNCIADYYSEFYDSITSTSGGGNVNIASLTSGVHHYTSGIDLRAPAAMVLSNKKLVLLVDGDVTIKKDINFDYPSASQTPFLMVIAKGNIIVDRSVENISGIFVAQPNGVSGSGSIVTCDETVDDDLFDECNKELRVTGSFIAQKIDWRRMSGDLFNAVPDTDRNSNDAAEVIDISPSLYYSSPPVLPKSQRYTYDSIRNLSPVF